MATGGGYQAPPAATPYDTLPPSPPSPLPPYRAEYAPALYAAVQPYYAGFWLRFLALVIDTIIVSLVQFPVAMVLFFIISAMGNRVSMPEHGISTVVMVVRFAFGMLLHWAYAAAMESGPRQATLGKMALGIYVTSEQGGRISFARATGRHFAKYISALTLLIGYIMAAFTTRKQALHDLLAGTLVMRGRP